MMEQNLAPMDIRIRIEDALRQGGYRTVICHGAGSMPIEPYTADLDIEVETVGGQRGRFRIQIDHAAVVTAEILDAAEKRAGQLGDAP